MEDVAIQLGIDIDRRTTRGRSCPRCGGKIIPSRRAVYQSAGDPNAVFPAWQCERCSYEELLARPVMAAPKHGAAPVKTANHKDSAAKSSTAAAAEAARNVPALRAVPA